MKLFEYETKEVILKYGIPTPEGGVATNVNDALEVARNIRAPYAVKGQVLLAGRGKAGGILFADSLSEVRQATKRILCMRIKDTPIRSVLVEEKTRTKRELYLGVAIDRAHRCHMVIASAFGGIDIEQSAQEESNKVARFIVDPKLGFCSFHSRQMVRKIGYSGRQLIELARILNALYQVCLDYDAELIETNPIVETVDGTFTAVDARMIVDDNALYRHQEYLTGLRTREEELTIQEAEAARNDLAYVGLDGNIGIVGNGAGLVMATLDTIDHYGGRPANFLDVGGGATSDKIASALRIVITDPNVRALFVNILGGITKCNEVAEGILATRRDVGIAKPMVIRLVGTNEKEGRRLLEREGVQVLDDMETAAQEIVSIVESSGGEDHGHSH